MKLKLSLIALLVFVSFQFAMAQSRVITGTVTDAKSKATIPGASIMIKGTHNGIVTDLDGKYSLQIPSDSSVLVFSFIGYKTLEKLVKKNKTLDIAMEPDNKSLDEVVVVGYGTQKEELRNSSGTISSTSSISNSKSSSKKEKVKTSKSMSENKGIRPIISENKGFKPIPTTQTPVQNSVQTNIVNDIITDPSNTEGYANAVENDFKTVLADPVSTFSVDVDKAAYSNIRRFLTGSQMPPKDAVRIEEMINYFDYSYPKPTDEHPFSVNMEMGSCSWDKKHYVVQIGIQGKTLKSSEIPPSNLVFLLDVSGSMSDPNKLPLVKSSMKILIEKLTPKDKVAIVVYAGAAGLALPSTTCSTDNIPIILEALKNLNAGGSTAGGAGIELAYKVALENFVKDGNNRVILATDGDFNVGASGNSDMEKLVEAKRKDGVLLTVLGFGMGNYKDDKMEILADKGNGNYAYIDNILESKKVFGKDLQGTLFTIAKDVKIQIEFNPAKIKAYRLIGYENRMLNREDFNNDLKDAGEIGAGHTVTALYEIIPADAEETVTTSEPLEYQRSTTIKSENLMTLKLRYKQPDKNTSILIEKRIKENEIKKSEWSENFKFSTAVAMFGMLLKESRFKGSANYADILTLAKQAKGSDEYGFRAEFIHLVEIAEALK